MSWDDEMQRSCSVPVLECVFVDVVPLLKILGMRLGFLLVPI